MKDDYDYFHSVTLDQDKCVGCTDCIKRCPTEAIRVKNGKAQITKEKCIDCGLCIDVCRHHAKKATSDPLRIINNYKYKIAIPAPTLYAQFKDIHDLNTILTAIKRLGFDDVFEVAKTAEMISETSKEYMKRKDIKKPVISSACPAIVRLIASAFPSLIDNILPFVSPMELTASYVKNYVKERGIFEDDIGIFFITPCAAKVTNVRKPIDVEKSEISGVISIHDVYISLMGKFKDINSKNVEYLCQDSIKGISWAAIGGEGSLLENDNAISVDGVENVMKVLELVENGQLEDIDFIESLACTGGCLGGALTIANNFVAKNNLIRVQKMTAQYRRKEFRHVNFDYDKVEYRNNKEIVPQNVSNLDDDLIIAIKKMNEITRLYKEMPQIDCGSCGAPTCLALAEDIVQGKGSINDCIFMLKKNAN